MMDASTGQFLGYVQVRVGARLYTVPVQSVQFDRDSDAAPGGLFEDKKGELGIWVAKGASDAEKEAMIKKASLEAATKLQRKFLN